MKNVLEAILGILLTPIDVYIYDPIRKYLKKRAIHYLKISILNIPNRCPVCEQSVNQEQRTRWAYYYRRNKWP